ncbi:MAG: SusC/RagA family TonB-linked outer membrane protein [Bacteroidales bacterium]|nr:SusC/RagA family TonB-linked outer membrane protein [Bacteroidales bacterium]MCF8404122.1 SusC/RagA family TonB-linked outer membrane protein [Bacteroidales bacterium]
MKNKIVNFSQKIRTIFSILFISCLLPLNSGFSQDLQNLTISGIVTDANSGDPLPGAAILIKGTQNGTISSLDGSFSIIAPVNSILVCSFIGYEPFEKLIDSSGSLDIKLQESAQDMAEVVVIGYGSSLKKEVTGSISSVKQEDFNKGSYSDAMGLIQGRVAGLTITKSGGADPMAGYNIILRGTNTLTSGQGPLIVIDGVAGADIKNVNFQDVVSVDVLKDGSAAAIYGTRGTNGVIIITTSRAKAGKSTVEFSSQLSTQAAPRGVDNLSADEFREAINTYAPSKAGSIYGASTNWFEEITRKLPLSQRYNLSMKGGTDVFSHRTVVDIEKNLGLLKDNESNRYLFRTNIRQKALNDRLTLDYNMIMGLRKYKPANYDLFYQAFIQNPTQPVYDQTNTEFGGYSSLPGIEYYNPVAMLNERDRNGQTSDISQNGRATLKIVEGLSFDNFVSYERSSWESNSYRTKYYPSRIGTGGEAEISNGISTNLQFESTLNYSETFGEHKVQAVGGYSFLESNYNDSYLINSGFDTDIYGVNNIGAGSALIGGTAEMGSYKESSRLIAFFGRVMYNYSNKYLASASFRREGSSRFGENNKWGSFPAISLGWRINNEDFMETVSWIDDLKLRIGYGVTGNQDFSNYKSLIQMGRAGKFFYNGNWINSYQPVSNPNPDLRWEKKKEVNAGLDFAILKNKITGSLDYYYRTSLDLLYTYDVAVPPYLYKELFTNVGTIRNQGVELSLAWDPVERIDFKWNTIFTFSRNSNKLVKFSNEEFTNTYIDIGWIGGAIPLNSQRITEGESLGTFFGPTWLGLDENGYDTFENANPIGKVNPEDWAAMGNAYPLFTMGWGNNFSYKKFNLNVNLRSNIGGKVLNFYRLYYENWQNIGTRNIVKTQLETPEFIGNAIYSSKYVEDATFLKLDNISLSYDAEVENKYISVMRFSLTAQDVFCLTKYKGLDPEVNLGGLTPGIEHLSYYPRTTSLTLGLNVIF